MWGFRKRYRQQMGKSRKWDESGGGCRKMVVFKEDKWKRGQVTKIICKTYGIHFLGRVALKGLKKKYPG